MNLFAAKRLVRAPLRVAANETGMDAGIAKLVARTGRLEDRLEAGELARWPDAPFPIPDADDRAFLAQQRLAGSREITYTADKDRVAGFRVHSADQTTRLRRILAEASRAATDWLKRVAPAYAAVAVPTRVNFHPEEQAIRTLRTTAREDLLHIDAVHESGGARLLRLYVNLHPTDDRVWITSDTFSQIYPTFGHKANLSAPPAVRLGQKIVRWFRGQRTDLTPYDEFMLGFARALKHSDPFQDKAPRNIVRFAPLSAWLAFTDGLVHADLRGQFLLDFLFLIPTSLLVRPESAPSSIILRTPPAPMMRPARAA